VEVQERRRFARFYLPLAVAFQTRCGATGDLLEGEAVTRDLGLEGLSLLCPFPNSFHYGQVVDLVITLPLPQLHHHDTPLLKARGEVVRLDPPTGPRGLGGVALWFRDGLCFDEPSPPEG